MRSLHSPTHSSLVSELTVPILHAGLGILTLYSADTPLSVSRSELHGNCPVTLYKFTEKLGGNGTEL